MKFDTHCKYTIGVYFMLAAVKSDEFCSFQSYGPDDANDYFENKRGNHKPGNQSKNEKNKYSMKCRSLRDDFYFVYLSVCDS